MTLPFLDGKKTPYRRHLVSRRSSFLSPPPAMPCGHRPQGGKFSYADAGQMHLYLNYAREHWMKAGENPPVGLILCAEKGAAEAHYALDNLPNKVLATEYQTVLPDERLIAEELERSRLQLE